MIRRYVKPRIKTNAAGMNKTEEKYAEHLRTLKLAGDIVDWRFEPFNLRLAQKTFYKVDFMIIRPECMEFHEVKGFWRDDARIKIKVAADKFPFFVFRAVQLKKNDWIYEEF